MLAGENRKEKAVKKWFSRDNLVILILAGVLLFVIALPTKEKEEEKGNMLIKEKTVSTEDATEVSRVETQRTWEEYACKQEDRLKTLLTSMDGVGNVEVMLTFVSSEELVVEKDTPTVRSNTVEKDSAGGSRTVSQFEEGDTTVYNDVSGTAQPYVIKTLNPRVEGALVVAQGASDPEICMNITEAVQALFGVEAHRVKVVDMDS